MKQIKKTTSPFKDYLTKGDCVTNCVAEGNNFFYNLTVGEFKEWGIGYILKGELQRELAFYIEEGGVKYNSRNNLPSQVYDGIGDIRSYSPSDFRHLMAMPNSVLTTMDCGTPSPVELQDETLLGMMGDRIQSIDAGELASIMVDVIPQVVCDADRPYVLKTNHLDVAGVKSKIAVSIIHLKPGPRPTPAQPGTIIFNSANKTFEGYDGTTWKNISP